MKQSLKQYVSLVISLVILLVSSVSSNAKDLYEPGEIYERYSIPDGRMILCRVNIRTGMDEKSLDNGETWIVAGGNFCDTQGVWCEKEVKVCFENGILKGKTYSEFSPYEPLTNTEALVAATRLSGYFEGMQVDFKNTDVPKYISCRDYLIDRNAIGAEAMAQHPDEYCSRYELVKLLFSVVPTNQWNKINEVRFVTDTEDSDIIKLYQAGILSGQRNDNISFGGDKRITRGAVAAIVARIVDSEYRVKF